MRCDCHTCGCRIVLRGVGARFDFRNVRSGQAEGNKVSTAPTSKRNFTGELAPNGFVFSARLKRTRYPGGVIVRGPAPVRRKFAEMMARAVEKARAV